MNWHLSSVWQLLRGCLLAHLLLFAASASGESDFAGTACGPIATTEAQVSLNLNASDWPAAPFSVSSPQVTSNLQLAFSAFDAGGGVHSATLFFAKMAASNIWEWALALPPSETTTPPVLPSDPFVVVGSGQLTFDTAGTLVHVSGNSVLLDFTGGAPPGQPLTISFGPIAGVGSGEPTTQYVAQSAVNSTSQNGLSADQCRFADFLKVRVQPTGERLTLGARSAAWVAIYGSPEVPVRALSRRSLRFGPERVRPLGGHRSGFWRRHMRDLNGDKVPDLLLRFPARSSGLTEPRDAACLEGLVAGRLFHACDSVDVCGPFCLAEIDPRMLCGPEPTSRVGIGMRLGEGDVATAPFDPSNSFNSSSFRTLILVFDSLGGRRAVTLFFSRISTGLWEWSVAVDPRDTIHPPAQPGNPFVLVASGELAFDASGTLVSPDIHPVVFDFSGGAAPAQTIDFDFAGDDTLSTPTSSWSGRSHFLGSTQNGQAPDDCRIEVIASTPEDRSYRPEDRPRD